MPRPRAALTYGFANSSSSELRVNWVILPIALRDRAKAGKNT